MLTLNSNEAKYYPSPKKKRKKRILLFSVVDLHHQKKKKSSITIIIFEMLSVDKEWEFVFSCITAFMLSLAPKA